MMDQRISKTAKTMVEYSTKIKKGDFVVIQCDIAAMPLGKELYKYCILAGANPYVMWGTKELDEIRYKLADNEQLAFVSKPVYEAYKNADVILSVVADTNTRALSNIDPEKMRIRAAGLQELNMMAMERMEKGEIKTCVTLFPTDATAQEASMSLTEYEDFVFDACGVNAEDPVEKWSAVKADQERLCNILNGKKQVRIVSKDTDLTMSIEGRTWVNCSGEANFPDGEIFTAPVEESLEGKIRFSFPGIFNGKEIEDIRLTFKGGKVVEATAAKGEELLLQLLDTDQGSRTIGEFGIGTNYGIKRFTKHMLFDEKIGGTIHLALGIGFPECGSRNMSGIHWDMLCDMREEGAIYADGELIYSKGKFLI